MSNKKKFVPIENPIDEKNVQEFAPKKSEDDNLDLVGTLALFCGIMGVTLKVTFLKNI